MARQRPIQARAELTVTELCAAYLRHAQVYYRRQDGTPTTGIHRVRQALEALRRL